jgi:hypothetical protein
MARNFIYDTYKVSVPGDAADSMLVLGNLAIAEARERTKLECTPVEWSAIPIGGEVGDFEVIFKVVRKRADCAKRHTADSRG